MLVAVAMLWAAPDAALAVEGVSERLVLARPPAPGSAEAWLRSARRAELTARRGPAGSGAPPSPLEGLLKYTAANYSKLAGLPWQIVHQQVSVEMLATSKRLQIHDRVTIRGEKPGVDTVKLLVRAPVEYDVRDGKGALLKTKLELKQGGQWGALEVWLPAPVTVGDQVTLDLQLQTEPKCAAGKGQPLSLCSFGPGPKALATGLMLLNAEDFRDPSTLELEVITEGDEQAGAPGVPSPAMKLPDGRLSWKFAVPHQTNGSGFTVAGSTEIIGDPIGAPLSPGNPQVRFRVQKLYSARAAQLLVSVKKALAVYEQRFGPYPYQTWNMNQGHAKMSGAVAFVGGTVFGRKLVEAVGGAKSEQWDIVSRGVLNHELAHQWWALLVGQDKGSLPIHEGLTEFCSAYVHEVTVGDRRHARYNSIRFVYTVLPQDDVPLTSKQLHKSPAYPHIVYDKGSAVFGMLRHELGDEAFFAGTKALIAAFHHDFASLADMRVAFEGAAARGLGWFFQQWFYRPGVLRLQTTARVMTEGASWLLRLRLKQLGGEAWRYKLDLRARMPDGSTEERTVEVQTPGVGIPAMVTLLFDQRPLSVELDPDRRLLRHLSAGLKGDVNLDGLVDGADLVEVALRQGVALKVTTFGGQTWAEIDPRWQEQFDVDSSLSVGSGDGAAVISLSGDQVSGF